MSDYIQNLFAERIGGSSSVGHGRLQVRENQARARREAQAKHPETPISTWAWANRTGWRTRSSSILCMRKRRSARTAAMRITASAVPGRAGEVLMERVFGVKGIDPADEVCHSIGSKARARDDGTGVHQSGRYYCLMTAPGYGILPTMTRCGSAVRSIRFARAGA